MTLQHHPPGMEEDEAKKYQQWLWYQIAHGEHLHKTTGTHWSHDDNQNAQSLGFMIIIPITIKKADQGIPQLISLQRERTPKQVYQTVATMAEHGDALCKKAVAFLMQQKFKHPRHRFLHELEDDEWYSKR